MEFIGTDPNPLGRPRSYISRAPPPQQLTEFVIAANAPVPSSVPEYYFEMTVDQVLLHHNLYFLLTTLSD